MLYRLSLAFVLGCGCLAPFARGELSQAIDRVTIDGTEIPFGTVVEVTGKALPKDPWQEFAAASLRGIRLNGKALQETIEFQLCASGEFKEGESYRVRGRLMSARFNGAQNACLLNVEKVESAPDVTLGFADFADREATFDGVAASGGRLQLAKEIATVGELTAWPKSVEGKNISVRGMVRRTSTGWHIDRPTWQLTDIEDQLGQQVSLEGKLRDLTGPWDFRYRNVDLLLISDAGPRMTFDYNDDGRRVRVTGLLVQRVPSDVVRVGADSKTGGRFVVRGAKVEYLEKALARKQWIGVLYPSFHTVRDGVPELLFESSFRRNLLGNETRAMVIFERNSDVIESILRDATPATRDVIAKRMEDAKLDETLRLLYAAMLAFLNDERGRAFLARMSETPDNCVNIDAIYCLGIFPFLAPQPESNKTDPAWAAERMIALMTNGNPATIVGTPVWSGFPKSGESTVASITEWCSRIPTVLGKIDSIESRKALLDYALAGGAKSEQVVRILCSFKTPISNDDLLKLEKMTTSRGDQRMILSRMLRQKHPKAVSLYLAGLKDAVVYMDLRRRLSPEVVAELKTLAESATGKAKTHAQMLQVLGEKDPIPALLTLLEDPKWTDKNLVLYELARLGDRRAVSVIARLLRTAPNDIFANQEQLSASDCVSHGIDAIAHAGTTEAIRELIELLTVDLARLSPEPQKRKGFNIDVASHVIDLTGESFGTDVEAWRNWQKQHPTFSVSRELANPPDVFGAYADGQIDVDFWH